MKRGTLLGTVLSCIVITAAVSYLVYVMYLYFTNQIDPVFRSQSFISNDLIETPLSSDLIGFRFEQGSNAIPLQQNKTYLVYIASFSYSTSNSTTYIPLDVIDCTNPNLQGFKCLDFSSISNYTLFINTQMNMKSSIAINTYGCRDIDLLKTTMPDNCAEQRDIDNLINAIDSIIRFKLYTSQFNTDTKRSEVSYRNSYVYAIANQQILSQIKTQTQKTSVKQGLIIQSAQEFNSPIQYTQQDQSLDRNYALNTIGAGAYSIVILFMDEIIQNFQIQYPTLPQVLALVSSIITLLMLVGIIGRKLSEYSINSDFLMLFLRNKYQGDYLQILKNNKHLFQSQNEDNESQIQQVCQNQRQIDQQEYEEQREIDNQIFIPAIEIKQKKSLEKEYFDNNTYNTENILSPIHSQKTTFVQKDYLLDNKGQDIMLEEIQEIPQLNINELSEIDSNFDQSTKNKKQNFSKYSSPTHTSQQAIIRKAYFKKGLEKPQLQFQHRKSIDCNNKNLQLMQNLRAIKNAHNSNQVQQNLRRIRKQEKDLNEFKLANIEKEIKKEMNIFNFVNDIIQIKKAIMMIFTKDQLAALQIVGCSSSFIDKELKRDKQDVKNLVNGTSLSHYEAQLAIQQSQNLQIQYLQEFFSRCSDRSKVDEIDKRILQSIQKCNQI